MYLGHFTNLRSLELIIERMRMKFGVLSNTNDPFENKNLLFKVAITNKNLRLVTTTDRLLKNNVKDNFKLICMTLTNNSEQIYEKPRMWEQYADNHRGCCLIFNKDKLDQQFKKIKSSNELYANRRVYYTLEKNREKIRKMIFDEDIESRLYQNGFKQQIISDYIWENREVFLFSKMEDWISEKEYRYLIYSQNRNIVYMEIADALEEIILGEKVTNEYTGMIFNKFVSGEVKISKIEWVNGFPLKKEVEDRIYVENNNTNEKMNKLTIDTFKKYQIE